MAKLEKEVAAFLKDLSKSDQELFMTYCDEHAKFLEKGATTTSSKNYEESSSVENEEETKEVVRTTTTKDEDNDEGDDSSEYEAGYKPSNSEIEKLASKYAQKELAVYNHDDYAERAEKLDEELAKEVSHWTKSAKEKVFELQDIKFDKLVDSREKKASASDDDE